MDFDSWVLNLRELLVQATSPLSLRNGHWAVQDRKSNWELMGPRLFDSHLDEFSLLAAEVLTESSPKFELPAEERSYAYIPGDSPSHSSELRTGLAESLAFLGNRGSHLINCSNRKPELTAHLTVRSIFQNQDWKLWASLNDLLPTLAEAAPSEFLDAIENGLNQDPCLFDLLFEQEGGGAFGSNYLTGTLWGLECLSWSENYLGRASLLLAELATHDPGGQWSNRPINSLTTIFLPWLPQTFAPIDKRVSSIKAITRDFPDIAWNVLLSLLPNQHQTSSGTHKPRWTGNVPSDWKPEVKKNEYWDQVTVYSEMAAEMAENDSTRLIDLTHNLDNLPRPSFKSVLEHLSSKDIVELPEAQREPIWSSLNKFIRKHRRFSYTSWALEKELVNDIESVANKLVPTVPENLYLELFRENDSDLFEENDDWEAQQELISKRRQQAIKEILDLGGIERVISFLEVVKSHSQVGQALSQIASIQDEIQLLPQTLNDTRIQIKHFIGGFIWGRFKKLGWDWVDKMEVSNWKSNEVCGFLMLLPFNIETWRRVENWLGDSKADYWKQVVVSPFQAESDLLLAVDNLLAVDRPQSAIDCLYARLHQKKPLDHARTVKALLAAVSTKEQVTSRDSWETIELIQALQSDPGTDESDLLQVEWSYIPLLHGPGEAKPEQLEKGLATNPEFFCDVVRSIYRSKNKASQQPKPTESEKAIATNAWQLLHDWKRPPGLTDKGEFSETVFKDWLEKVKEVSRGTGHFEVSMLTAGEVLYYCPADPSGLWINLKVAESLNAGDASKLRRGFATGVFNSRGSHWVDPTGSPEIELANEWKSKAEAIEKEGFARFATSLRELAESYRRDAESIIEEHDLADED